MLGRWSCQEGSTCWSSAITTPQVPKKWSCHAAVGSIAHKKQPPVPAQCCSLASLSVTAPAWSLRTAPGSCCSLHVVQCTTVTPSCNSAAIYENRHRRKSTFASNFGHGNSVRARETVRRCNRTTSYRVLAWSMASFNPKRAREVVVESRAGGRDRKSPAHGRVLTSKRPRLQVDVGTDGVPGAAGVLVLNSAGSGNLDAASAYATEADLRDPTVLRKRIQHIYPGFVASGRDVIRISVGAASLAHHPPHPTCPGAMSWLVLI